MSVISTKDKITWQGIINQSDTIITFSVKNVASPAYSGSTFTTMASYALARPDKPCRRHGVWLSSSYYWCHPHKLVKNTDVVLIYSHLSHFMMNFQSFVAFNQSRGLLFLAKFRFFILLMLLITCCLKIVNASVSRDRDLRRSCSLAVQYRSVKSCCLCAVTLVLTPPCIHTCIIYCTATALTYVRSRCIVYGILRWN